MAGSGGVKRWPAALPVASLPVASGSIPPLWTLAGNAGEPGKSQSIINIGKFQSH